MFSHYSWKCSQKKKKKKKNLELRHDLISLKGYIGSLAFYAKFSHMSKKKLSWTTWWHDLSQVLHRQNLVCHTKCNNNLGRTSLWKSRYKKTMLLYESKHHYKTLLPEGMQSHHESKHHYENVAWHLENVISLSSLKSK